MATTPLLAVTHTADGQNYRADIDGLRTIAVVPVVLFHAGLSLMPGGFVGVDIFFVISGYLITQTLLRDLADGRFSIVAFYRRRIRRIFPALIVVIAASLAIGERLLMPSDYASLGSSALLTIGFVSNIFFWRSFSYFADANYMPPLLHTWSLSVEEQFYIFYPPMLFVLYRYSRSLLWSTGLIGAASFCLAAILVLFKPSAAFYLLPTRTWELMIGGWLAIADGRIRTMVRSVHGRAFAGAIGLTMIAVPMFTYDRYTPFPGLTALPPVLGAALVIVGGGQGSTFVSRFLSNRLFVAIGRASFSLYLWHFPIISFIRYLTDGPLSLAEAVTCCMCSLAMAFLSLYIVERPFRRPVGSAWLSHSVRLLLAAMGVLIVPAILIVVSKGWPNRLGDDQRRAVAAAEDKNRHPMACMTNGTVIFPPERACLLGATAAAPHILLWGDSHAAVAATAMIAEADQRGRSFLYAGSADCPVGLGFDISPDHEMALSTTPSYRFCGEYNRRMLALALTRPDLQRVVIANRWANWRLGVTSSQAEGTVDLRLRDHNGTATSSLMNVSIFTKGFIALVRRLTAAGKTVYIVGPIPEPPFNVPHHAFVAAFGLTDNMPALSEDAFRTRNSVTYRLFKAVSAAAPVRFVWPSRWLCSAGACPISTDGSLNYFDYNHLTVAAARRTAPAYRSVFTD